MKVSFFLLLTLAMLSCTAVCDKQEGDLTMEDPEPRGLVSYQPLEITFHREIMPDYDSVSIYYSIGIEKPLWTDKCHDSIRIHRLPNNAHERVMWDRAILSVWDAAGHGWKDTLFLNYGKPETGSCGKELLSDILDTIYAMAEKNIFYMDENDWKRNKAFYLNPKLKVWMIRGKIRIK